MTAHKDKTREEYPLETGKIRSVGGSAADVNGLGAFHLRVHTPAAVWRTQRPRTGRAGDASILV